MAEKVTIRTSDAGHVKVFSPLDTGTFVPQLVWLALTFGLLLSCSSVSPCRALAR